jgi:two-component system sensor histidine kinase VicK
MNDEPLSPTEMQPGDESHNSHEQPVSPLPASVPPVSHKVSRLKMRRNIGIRQRIYILFFLVAVVPLVIINAIWFRSSQTQLTQAAVERQSILLNGEATRLDSAVDVKVHALTTQSEAESTSDDDVPNIKTTLLQYDLQDADVEQVSFVDASGNELVRVVDDKAVAPRASRASDPIYQAAVNSTADSYIGPVFYDGNTPQFTIAVPVKDNTKIVGGKKVNAQLIATIDLTTLWSAVLDSKLGLDGYAYIVDNKGHVIAYQDKKIMLRQADYSAVPEVKKSILNTSKTDFSIAADHFTATPTVSRSENGTQVLSSNYPIAATAWSIIGEEPISSVFAKVHHISAIATYIFVTAIPVAFILVFLATRSIVMPLKRLREGAERIGGGELDFQIPVASNDEIGSLAQTFNKMASNLTLIVKQVEAESNKVSVILNNVGEGVIAVDEAGVIISVNLAAATLMGEVPLSVVGKHFNYFQWVLAGKEFTPTYGEVKVYKDITLISANKREHFVDVLVNPIQGDPSGIRTILTIIDKTAEQELENMKVDFVSMAAHELRTPLTAIKGYIELIASDDDSHFSDQTTTFLERLKYSSGQSVGLINNLLNVSRIERGALSLSMERIDWNELVTGAVEDEQVSARIKMINLITELPDEHTFVLADRYAISEVINNLMSNAIKYTMDNGTVTVKVSQQDGHILTEVIDTGIGMPEDAIKHLFTKFYRAHGGLASGSGGTGLGLYISKSIAELHDGQVSVTSVEGQGSTFSVLLPVFDQKKYDILKQNGQIKESRAHGWTTTNIAR